MKIPPEIYKSSSLYMKNPQKANIYFLTKAGSSRKMTLLENLQKMRSES